MVRFLIGVVVSLSLVACVDEESDDTITLMPDKNVVVDETKADENIDICALAAELPEDDICSLVCDYEAFKAQAIENGMEAGACYTFRCTLPGDVGVNVGVCNE